MSKGSARWSSRPSSTSRPGPSRVPTITALYTFEQTITAALAFYTFKTTPDKLIRPPRWGCRAVDACAGRCRRPFAAAVARPRLLGRGYLAAPLREPVIRELSLVTRVQVMVRSPWAQEFSVGVRVDASYWLSS